MRKIPVLILSIVICFSFNLSALSATVEAGGSGSTTQSATVNALRNAVAQGAGVDVSSRSLVENFMLQYDRIITSSEGYVKSFSVLGDVKEKDGTHSVTIKADVEQGRPGMNELAALRTIYDRMEQPRVLIVCNENISGLSGYSPKILQYLLTDMANNAGFSVVDIENFLSETQRVALIDKYLKNTSAAQLRLSEINKPFELLIVAELSGNAGLIEKNLGYNGVDARNVSFTLNLKAVWRDTSENVAALTCGPINGACATPALIASPEQMVTHYVKEMVTGNMQGLNKGDTVINFFEKIICRWVRALEKGSNITLTFNDLDEASLKKLTGDGGLQNVEGVSNVRVRSFVPGLQSVIELNGAITANEVKSEVLRILGGSYKIHHMERNSMEFQRSGALNLSMDNPLIWIVAGLAALFMGLLAIAFVVFMIMKSMRASKPAN